MYVLVHVVVELYIFMYMYVCIGTGSVLIKIFMYVLVVVKMGVCPSCVVVFTGLPTSFRFVRFFHYNISRDSLLNKRADVTAEGVYVTPYKVSPIYVTVCNYYTDLLIFT